MTSPSEAASSAAWTERYVHVGQTRRGLSEAARECALKTSRSVPSRTPIAASRPTSAAPLSWPLEHGHYGTGLVPGQQPTQSSGVFPVTDVDSRRMEPALKMPPPGAPVAKRSCARFPVTELCLSVSVPSFAMPPPIVADVFEAIELP